MIMQLSKYRNNVDFIKSMLEREKDTPEMLKLIARMSIATGVPVVVVTHYVGELIGFSDELNQSIERLKLFYGYTSVEE